MGFQAQNSGNDKEVLCSEYAYSARRKSGAMSSSSSTESSITSSPVADEPFVDCLLLENGQYIQTYISLSKLKEIAEKLNALTQFQRDNIVFAISIQRGEEKPREIHTQEILFKLV